jgi:outer membrane protein
MIPSLVLANESFEAEDTIKDDGEFKWELMLGISAIYAPEILKGVENNELEDYLDIPLWIDMSYKGFFIRSNKRRATTYSGELGYELISKEDWGLDIITKTYLPEINAEEIIERNDKPIPVFEGLATRDFGGGLALRYNKYEEDSRLTIEFAYLNSLNISNNWLVDSFYSYLIPYRNWDIYLGGGLTIYSNHVANYYYGISAEEVSPVREQYSAGMAFRAQFEIFAQYPISESWSFNTGVTQNYYSNSITKSPIIEDANITQLLIGFRYVY